MIWDYIANHRNLTLVFAGLAAVGLTALTLRTLPQTTTAPTVDTTKITSVTSPISKVKADLRINDGLQADPNNATAKPSLEVFGIEQLPIPTELTYKLIHEDLLVKLERQIIPTYAFTYVHINHDTIKCDTEYDCAFSFYVDSPESYYSYRAYLNPDGSQAYTLTQEPLPTEGTP